MALKNITCVEELIHPDESKTRLRLIDDVGECITAFDFYQSWVLLRGYPPPTVRRYSFAVARFIDYLIELKVLGQPTSEIEINRAIDNYPMYLKDGTSVDALGQTKILRSLAEVTGLGRGLAKNSFAPVLAAVNGFLRISQTLAYEANKIARQIAPNVGDDFDLIIQPINGTSTLTSFEKKRMQQNSMLGGVIRICGPVSRPRHLQSLSQKRGQVDRQRLDFPLSEMPKLLAEAKSYRDKALWSLQLASGIRTSEALNLRLCHVDSVNQTIFVENPNQDRSKSQLNTNKSLPFKGRATSRVVLFEPMRSIFFKYLEEYLKHEFVCTTKHDFVFQVVERNRRGEALNTASDAAVIKNFKDAVRRAGIEGPPGQPNHLWTPHSLRHAYGVYMLNYIPVPDGFGLSLSEVQTLMGHRSPNTTRGYARHDELLLAAKMEFASESIYRDGVDVEDLPKILANRMISLGTAILAGESKI